MGSFTRNGSDDHFPLEMGFCKENTNSPLLLPRMGEGAFFPFLHL